MLDPATDVRYRAAGGKPLPPTRALLFTCCGSIHDVSCPTCDPELSQWKPFVAWLDRLQEEVAEANAARELAEAELAAERLKNAKARQKSWALAKLMSAEPSRELCAQLAEALGMPTFAEMISQPGRTK